ncbi:MAG: alpha-galactosidase [Deltaproteobacteria bacterium]|nr:alpha-galactosidase [Deltaproteobacteria bacterium]
MLFGVLVLGLSAVAGCGSDEGAAPAAVPTVRLVGGNLTGASAAGSFALAPRVQLNGKWQAPTGPCVTTGEQADPAEVACPVAPSGTLRVRRQALAATGAPRAWVVEVELAEDATIQGFELTGTWALESANQWWSQGFQSWSQSGILALATAQPSEQATTAALSVRGDSEVMRTGAELSWWSTEISGGKKALVVTALSAEQWRSWSQVWGEGGKGGIRLVSGASGEAVPGKKGQKIQSEPWVVAATADRAATWKAIAKLWNGKRDEAEIGWNSWYELWDSVSEASFLANLAKAKEHLASADALAAYPDAGRRIVLDDGWQVAWGDWRTNSKFPSGLPGLVKQAKADGFSTGLWLAPLLVSEKLPIVAEHPDWFVGGSVYNHLKNGNMRVLDVSHPQAAAHLAGQVKALADAGLTLLKIDFLFAGTWEGTRHEPLTGMQAYVRSLELIQKAAGPAVKLLAVGAPPLGTIGRVGGWRQGNDVALETFGAVWAFLPSQLRTLSVRWPYCFAVACDADPALLRSLTPDEVGFGALTVAAAGGGWWLSDDLTKLPGERLGLALQTPWTKAALAGPGVPEPALSGPPPATLVSGLKDFLGKQSTHVVPTVWQLGTGGRAAVNPNDQPISVHGIEIPPHSARTLP